MSFERFEIWTKKTTWTSIILFLLFVTGTIFNISDYGNRLFNVVKNIAGYEEPVLVEASGDGFMEKRMNLARLEATKYKIPSSSSAVIKFLGLPMFNNFITPNITNSSFSTHAIVATVSPIRSTLDKKIFDGADCRFGVEASVFDKVNMEAQFKIVSLSCTDNEGYAYSVDAEHSIGYISEIGNPGVPIVNIVDNDGYLTVDPNVNYFAQLYEPIESINRKGISLFGRF